MLGSQAAPLATFTVNSTTDATDAVPGDGVCETAIGNVICTLRAAIRETNALAGTDEIILPAGAYTLTIPGAGENNAATGDLDINGPLTISGAGAATTIIDANGLDRVLDIQAQGNLWLAGVTVQGGWVGSVFSGGGINMFFGGNLTVTDCIITANTAGWGAGIAQLSSSPQIIIMNSTISQNNSTSSSGGGLYINGANLQIIDSVISGNSAQYAGGLLIQAGFLTMTNRLVDGNTAVNTGGGINMNAGGLIISSSIQNNTANGSDPNTHGGGGIFNGGTLTVSDSQIINNNAPNEGGGGVLNGGSLVLENIQVAYNTANYGGGLYNYWNTASVVGIDVSVVQNSAWAGGGIYSSAGTFTLTEPPRFTIYLPVISK